MEDQQRHSNHFFLQEYNTRDLQISSEHAQRRATQAQRFASQAILRAKQAQLFSEQVRRYAATTHDSCL